MTKIAIIGGSGLENPEILQNVECITMKTPYGDPSSDFICGRIGQVEVVLLSRHGRDHTIPPSQVNNRANLYAIKQMGCSHILATTACGSLRENIGRGDLVIPDQFIDFTRHRETTFFKEFLPNEMKHTPMAEPFSKNLSDKLIKVGRELGLTIHPNGCIITIEGPRFSTRAESRMFRAWGGDMINMSTAPECILANELGIPYAAVAMATDYDSWKEDETPVSWEEILEVFGKNVHNVINILLKVIPTV
ncbi:MAG TPA: S-methyl-5'-thioadenosine phosphorylase [Prolixibacteraceae bacterium]|jgi:5'-methylthioadenosine phosphorylase